MGIQPNLEKFNRLLASPSMALWLPFEDYRITHLAHHVNENLLTLIAIPRAITSGRQSGKPPADGDEASCDYQTHSLDA